MAQYDSSAYPLVTALNANDRVLFWQTAQSRCARVSANTIAAFLAANGEQLTIAGLKAKDVTSISTGAAVVVGGYYTIGDGGGGAFFYDSAATDADNGGTIIAPNSGVGRWFRPESSDFNVREFGALGDGSHDDTVAIQNALDAVQTAVRGAVYIPAGKYKIAGDLTFSATPDSNLTVYGDGPNVSIVIQTQAGASGFAFDFKNTGVQQPYTCTIRDIGLESSVIAATGIIISYGDPAATSTHYTHGPLIQNVGIRSSDAGYWSTGIDIESAWNAKITECVISGSPFGGTWASMIGSGIRLRRLCANTHILNNSINFWQTGLYYSAEGGAANNPNAEGIFCENNSMVAVKRGVWIQGNPSATNPWMTGFQWIGGLIELRAAVQGINLEACSDAVVSGTFILQDNPSPPAGSCGVLLTTCRNSVISDNRIYVFETGVKTGTSALGISVTDNIFIGGGNQVEFGVGTSYSVSRGSIVTSGAGITELNAAATGNRNKIYQGLDYGFSIGKDVVQSIPNTTETSVIWGPEAAVIRNDLDWNLAPGVNRFWASGTPTRIIVPSGVNWVKLTAGIRFDTNSTGFRAMKIRSPETLQNWAAVSTAADAFTDLNASTPVIPVKDLGITYFDVVVSQTSGGALDVRAVEGTFVELEIIG